MTERNTRRRLLLLLGVLLVLFVVGVLVPTILSPPENPALGGGHAQAMSVSIETYRETAGGIAALFLLLAAGMFYGVAKAKPPPKSIS